MSAYSFICRCLLLPLSLLLFFGTIGRGQTAEVLPEQETLATARAYQQRGARMDHFAAGLSWEKADSFSRAIAAFEQVIAAQPADSLAGLAWHRIGVAHYQQYAETAAVAAYNRAIQVRDELFATPHRDRAHSRLNLAQTLMALGRNDTATHVLQEAIDLYTRAQPTDSLNLVRAYSSLSQLGEDARDYRVGVTAARQAVFLLEQLEVVDPLDVFDIWYFAGKTYLTFGELTAAAAAADRALAVGQATGDALLLLDALNLAAGIRVEQQAYEAATRLYQQALSVMGNREFSQRAGLLHFNLALAYARLEALKQARYHGAQAREMLGEDTFYGPRVCSVLADIHWRAGEYPEALQTLRTGVAQILRTEDTEDVSSLMTDTLEVHELEILADLLGDRARVLEKLAASEEALRDYYALFAVWDKLRQRVTSDVSRRYLSKNLRPFFDRAIALEFTAFAAGEAAAGWRAFLLSERAKAYSLLTSVQQDRAKRPRREAALRARIAALERRATPASPAAQRLAAARLELDRLLRLAAAPIAAPAATLDRPGLQRLLQTQQTDLLAFYLGPTVGYRWLLRPDGTLFFERIAGVDTLPEAITHWRAAIQQGAYRRKSLRAASEQNACDAAFLRGGVQLYAQLIGNFSLGERLCVLPDGPLLTLPFGALLPRAASLPLDYDQLAYLQTKTSVQYAYSASVWKELCGRPVQEHEWNLLAFAPAFRPPGQQPKGAANSLAVRNTAAALPPLAPLRHNVEEVAAIAALIPRSKAFYADSADRENFLAQSGRARIVHLSTHGLADAGRPERSFVAFSQRGDSLTLEEVLFYSDLSALPITTELAVLSACETNLGAYVPGETTLSLSSAFQAAGARSTLTTLWQVDDAATRTLMVAFYRNLVAGESRTEALAAAQRQLQQGTEAHPFYWAAFTLYGAGGPLALRAEEKRIPVTGIGIMLLLLLGGGVYGWHYRGRRQVSDNAS